MAVMRAARENLRKNRAAVRWCLFPALPCWPTAAAVYEDDAPPSLLKTCLPMAAIACSWSSGCGRISPTRSSCGCPRSTVHRRRRKNFLFDLHTITPAMLKPEKYNELAAKSPLVQTGYTLADNGFYKLNGTADKTALKEFFAGNDFNALAFTDSRSRYQFYNLGRLWQDIETARAAGLTMLHLCTPPISAAEVYTAVTGNADWTNELPKSPFDYDLRSRYAAVLGGSGDYLCTKEEELDDVTHFLREWRD